ncbi:MAG: hypothetical protein JWM68_4027 [Verrucomicrobiales bacterium]|nr:hypothetical protein [Verrucomicrobiales bacterium]
MFNNNYAALLSFYNKRLLVVFAGLSDFQSERRIDCNIEAARLAKASR